MTVCTLWYRHEFIEPHGDVFTEGIDASKEGFRKKVEDIAEMLREADAESLSAKILAEGEEYDGETLDVLEDLEVEIYEGAHATREEAEQSGQLLYRFPEAP